MMRTSRWLLALACLGSIADLAAQPADTERGRRIFHGELALPGRVAGHTAALPVAASRCVNCHAAGTALPSAPAASVVSASSAPSVAAPSTQSFGPVLNAQVLTQDRRRRGGPPSRYDSAALCKLLSTGIDPAYIIIPASMPRYDISAAECQALWSYLVEVRP